MLILNHFIVQKSLCEVQKQREPFIGFDEKLIKVIGRIVHGPVGYFYAVIFGLRN